MSLLGCEFHRRPAFGWQFGKLLEAGAAANDHLLSQCAVRRCNGRQTVSIGLILIIILVIFLLGGFSGRFGGYGYGYGHGGVGVIGVILIVLVILLLTGRLG
jgi:amino acid transporter